MGEILGTLSIEETKKLACELRRRGSLGGIRWSGRGKMAGDDCIPAAHVVARSAHTAGRDHGRISLAERT